MSAPSELQAIRSLMRREDLTEHLHEILSLQRNDIALRIIRHQRWLLRKLSKTVAKQPQTPRFEEQQAA